MCRVMADAANCEAAIIVARSSRLALKASSDSFARPAMAQLPRPNISDQIPLLGSVRKLRAEPPHLFTMAASMGYLHDPFLQDGSTLITVVRS
jgi:hypothetical protein